MLSVTMAAGALMLVGCSTVAPDGTPAGQFAGVGPPIVTPIARSSRTISDQPLRLPQGAAEFAAAAVDIPAGESIPLHQHPWSRFVYVERGAIRIINRDTGTSLDFQTGLVFAEVIGQWHEAQAIGAVGARIIVIDVVPPGVNNMVMPPH
jgi:quercetin dioxygenase-like cupin family protein